VSYIVDLVVKTVLFKDLIQAYRYTFKILFIKILIFVHGAFVLKGMFCYWQCATLDEYLKTWLFIAVLIPVVYVPFTMFARKKFFHHSHEEDDLFQLIGKGKKPFNLVLENLIYAKSDDNYVDLIQVDPSGSIKKEIFRSTLDSIAEQLSGQREFIRVHRSYLVNLRFATNLIESKTLGLRYSDVEFNIPVSKTYLRALQLVLTP
jgi:hypothetical protein